MRPYGAAMTDTVTERAFTPRVVALLGAGVAYFVVAGISFPVLPRLVQDELGGSRTDIGLAFGFFKPAARAGDTIGGEPFHSGSSGAPILENAHASVECRVAEVVERGDHHIVIGEVIDATVARSPEGRPDHAILLMAELGDNIFYGG